MSALGLEHVPPREGGHAPTHTDSVIDLLRAGFNESTGPKHLDLPIPLRKGLGMRFIAVDRDRYDEIQRADEKDGNLDFLAASCECILLKDGEKADGSPKWRPAVVDHAPVKFDGSLSEIMGWHTDNAREEVLRAFGKVPQPYLAVAEHVALVQAWMAGRAEQREEDLLGES